MACILRFYILGTFLYSALCIRGFCILYSALLLSAFCVTNLAYGLNPDLELRPGHHDGPGRHALILLSIPRVDDLLQQADSKLSSKDAPKVFEIETCLLVRGSETLRSDQSLAARGSHPTRTS